MSEHLTSPHPLRLTPPHPLHLTPPLQPSPLHPLCLQVLPKEVFLTFLDKIYQRQK